MASDEPTCAGHEALTAAKGFVRFGHSAMILRRVCGVAGVYELRPGHEPAGAVIGRMVDAIRHRGPDDDGFFTADGVALGMCRLSIIDVAGGHQPLCDESGQTVVMQNGEIYNYTELRAELVAKGHHLRTDSDTEVIAHLYEDDGLEFPKRLNGMFAIALFDRRHQRLVLVRDRLGKKPLFLYEDAERLLFASEIKGLLASGLVKTGVDRLALHDFLSFNFVPPPRTMFRAIRHLAPGTMLVAERGRLSERRFWELPAGPAEPWTHSRATEWLDLFEDAVSIRLRADVPVGLFLSGGVDSSAVAWAAGRAAHGPREAFTIGFDTPEFDETPGASATASELGLPLHVLRATDDLLDSWPDVIRAAEQPHGDASFMPMLSLARFARTRLKVVLTGEGADESLGGYAWHAAAPYNTTDPWPQVRARFEANAVFTHEEKLALYRGSLRSTGSARDSAALVAAQLQLAQDADPIAQTLFVDLSLLLPGNNLVKADRMGMACGLELRCPFMDYRLIELASTIPGPARVVDGIGKAPLRAALAPYLRAPANRPKRMFGVPLREWFRRSRHPRLAQLEDLPPLVAEWLDPAAVRRLLVQHRSGEFDHTRKLRAVLVVAMWADIFGSHLEVAG